MKIVKIITLIACFLGASLFFGLVQNHEIPNPGGLGTTLVMIPLLAAILWAMQTGKKVDK